jgi:hypothetical protein
MWLASLLLLCLVGGVAMCVALYLRAEQEVRAGESLLRRVRAAHAERARFVETREGWAEGSGQVEAAVDLGTAVTQVGHMGIAAIPFSVLEAIPSTAQSAKVVRAQHDLVAGTVYGAISGLNAGIGSALRRVLSGDQPDGATRPRPRPMPGPKQESES